MKKCGIYKITNLINNKVYIGCSCDIEHRWIAHKSESILEHNPQYNYSIHRAFRKYGLDNFHFEIIELLSDSTMIYEREKYWIAFYDSYNSGYNETQGGDCGPVMSGDENPNSKLTEADVIAIRTAILEGKMLSEVYPNYANKITRRGFSHVWQGDAWQHVIPEAVQYVKSDKYLKSIKSYAAKQNVSLEKQIIRNEIMEKRKKGLNRLDVYEEYKDYYSLSGFNKIWYQK